MNRYLPQIVDGVDISEGSARNLTDAFALAWMFFSVLALALLVLSVNTMSISMALFSVMLGGIWWALCHVRRYGAAA